MTEITIPFPILDFNTRAEECALCAMAVECQNFEIIKGADIKRTGCEGEALESVS